MWQKAFLFLIILVIASSKPYTQDERASETSQEPIKGEPIMQQETKKTENPLPEKQDTTKKETIKEQEKQPLAPEKEESPLVPDKNIDIPNPTGFIMPLILVFAALFGALFLLKKLFRGSPFALKEGALRVIAYKKLPGRKEFFLVQLGSRIYFIGGTRERLIPLGIISRLEDIMLIDPSMGKQIQDTNFTKLLNQHPEQKETNKEYEIIKEELDNLLPKLERFKDII